MKNKQTAVEWLIEQLWAPCRGIPDFMIEKAKQMEKEQMLDSFSEGYKSCACDNFDSSGKDFEQYYNETYGKTDTQEG